MSYKINSKIALQLFLIKNKYVLLTDYETFLLEKKLVERITESEIIRLVLTELGEKCLNDYIQNTSLERIVSSVFLRKILISNNNGLCFYSYVDIWKLNILREHQIVDFSQTVDNRKLNILLYKHQIVDFSRTHVNTICNNRVVLTEKGRMWVSKIVEKRMMRVYRKYEEYLKNQPKSYNTVKFLNFLLLLIPFVTSVKTLTIFLLDKNKEIREAAKVQLEKLKENSFQVANTI